MRIRSSENGLAQKRSIRSQSALQLAFPRLDTSKAWTLFRSDRSFTTPLAIHALQTSQARTVTSCDVSEKAGLRAAPTCQVKQYTF